MKTLRAILFRTLFRTFHFQYVYCDPCWDTENVEHRCRMPRFCDCWECEYVEGHPQ